MSTNYRESSRDNWYPAASTSREDVNAGSLQRIADAVEVMSVSYATLVRERNTYKSNADHLRADCERMARANAALRGVITKLKKRLDGAA